jgi:hypothetical protein
VNGPHDNTAPKGLRGWWLSPPRSGMRLLIAPWEYRHLRAWAGARAASAVVAAGLGAIIVNLAGDAWVIFGVFLLAVALAQVLFASWELSIARSGSA